MKLNFNRNFLREKARYLTFPVDFLKAESILFPQKSVSFYRFSSYVRQKSSWKNGVWAFHKNDMNNVDRHKTPQK